MVLASARMTYVLVHLWNYEAVAIINIFESVLRTDTEEAERIVMIFLEDIFSWLFPKHEYLLNLL